LTLLTHPSKINKVSSGESIGEVLQFVDRHIESVEQLEVLLLLVEDERAWKPAEILQRIQSSSASIDQRLASLRNAGFVSEESPGVFRYAPADEQTRRTIRDLADSYRERRVRIIEAIYSRKTDSVQTFADAFRFKRKE